MRIAYIANISELLPIKKTEKELRSERRILTLKNQLILDEKKAEKRFEKRLNAIEVKRQKLGL